MWNKLTKDHAWLFITDTKGAFKLKLLKYTCSTGVLASMKTKFTQDKYFCFPCTHPKEGHELENNNVIFIESIVLCYIVVRENKLI